MRVFRTLQKQATGFLEQYKTGNQATYAAAQQAIGAVLIADGLFGIDNPLGGRRRPGIFGTLAGLAVGVIFILTPVFMNSVSGVNKMTATTTATVVSVGNTGVSSVNNRGTGASEACSVTARYFVEGKERVSKSPVSSSSNCALTEGSSINISYNPENPNSWAHDAGTIDIFLQVFFWVGIFIVISSVVTFFIRLFSIIFGWKLIKNGRKDAAGLPPGTELSTMVSEIKRSFTSSIFNFGGGLVPGAATFDGGIQKPLFTQPTTNTPTSPPTQNLEQFTQPTTATPTTTSPQSGQDVSFNQADPKDENTEK